MRYLLWSSIGLAITAKTLHVYSPTFLKSTVDNFDNKDVALTMISLYAGSRVLQSFINESKTILATKFANYKTQEWYTSVVKSYLQHSSSSETGIHLKKLERGRNAFHKNIMIKYTHSYPLLIETILTSYIISSNLGLSYSLLMGGTLGLYIYYSIKVTNKRLVEKKEYNKTENNLNQYTTDILKNISTVRTNSMINYESNTLLNKLNLLYNKNNILNKSLFKLNFGQQSILAFGYFSLIGTCILSPDSTSGDVLMLNMLLLQLSSPLNQVGMNYRELKQTKIDIDETTNSLIPKQPLFINKPFYPPFVYNTQIAITGKSGCGKTEYLHYILNKYPNAYLLQQKPEVFHSTLKHNLTYGSTISDEKMIEVCKMLHLHETFNRIGYDTVISDTLSSGEKQRIAICRLLLQKKYTRIDILLIDEATSNIDIETEKLIIEILKKEFKTIIMVSHRQQSLQLFDKVISLTN